MSKRDAIFVLLALWLGVLHPEAYGIEGSRWVPEVTHGSETSKTPQLNPRLVKVRRIEPFLEGKPAGRPFMIEYGKPGGVPVVVLHHHVLAKNAFEGEAKPQSGFPAWLVQGIALPFIAPVAEILKHAPHHQEHGFRCCSRALKARRQKDIPHLDNAVRRFDPHEAGIS